MKASQKGAVALEFLLLFPLVVSLIYAAAIYGVLFSWQVRMQVAVDRASAAVMQLDRSATNDPLPMAVGLASNSLKDMDIPFPAASTSACISTGTNIVECSVTLELEHTGLNKLGFLGGFPPMPDNLRARGRVTF